MRRAALGLVRLSIGLLSVVEKVAFRCGKSLYLEIALVRSSKVHDIFAQDVFSRAKTAQLAGVGVVADFAVASPWF
jgi:hypothetical protein